MLTDEQLEYISDVLRPLFQYLEHEVIVDVARRIKESLAYTRTAEIEAQSLSRLGYSPARIRKEAMKLLRSDAEFRKIVAKNTLEHKKQVKKLLREITDETYKRNDMLFSDMGDLSYLDDLRVWKSNGSDLADDSYLHDLVNGIGRQTRDELTNITRTTGFKTMAGFESIQDTYRRELDKALIKICTGTFSKEEVIYDVIHDLAHSGLRTIDYGSGRHKQLDTAVKLAVRTGGHQLSEQISANNILNSGENLVYVSRHWGARNTGTGHANHEQWQGKVYYIKPGKNYGEEAKRIGQDYITDLWYATGYSMDGAHPNDPLGLNGYNCRHKTYVFFEGASKISDIQKEEPEPDPVEINGKMYDYYAMSQKMRAMERNIRALKREREALTTLGMDAKEIKARIKKKTAEYEAFCDKYGLKAKLNRLRYDNGTADITKTKAYRDYVSKSRENAVNASEIIGVQSKLREKQTDEIIQIGRELEMPIFDDGQLKEAYVKRRVAKESDFYDVVAHGAPEYMEFFGKGINHNTLKQILEGRSDYHGENIRLISCSTGWADDNGNCFAQRLADVMNVEVKAPNRLLYIHTDGTISVGSNPYKMNGEMVVFHPRKEQE